MAQITTVSINDSCLGCIPLSIQEETLQLFQLLFALCCYFCKFKMFRFLGCQNWGKDPKQGRSPKVGAKPLPQDRRLQGLE